MLTGVEVQNRQRPHQSVDPRDGAWPSAIARWIPIECLCSPGMSCPLVSCVKCDLCHRREGISDTAAILTLSVKGISDIRRSRLLLHGFCCCLEDDRTRGEAQKEVVGEKGADACL